MQFGREQPRYACERRLGGSAAGLHACNIRSLDGLNDRLMAAILWISASLPLAAVNLGDYKPLRLLGLGRYACAPALFLGEPDSRIGNVAAVLPVPVPQDSVMAIEQVCVWGGACAHLSPRGAGVDD